MTSCTPAEHDEGFASFLVEPGKRRFNELLSRGPKRRADLVAVLDHNVQFDDRFVSPLTGPDVTRAGVVALLARLRAPAECCLLSSVRRLDQMQCQTPAGVDEMLGAFGGTFLSLLPGQLGLFKYETGSPLLLKRGAAGAR